MRFTVSFINNISLYFTKKLNQSKIASSTTTDLSSGTPLLYSGGVGVGPREDALTGRVGPCRMPFAQLLEHISVIVGFAASEVFGASDKVKFGDVYGHVYLWKTVYMHLLISTTLIPISTFDTGARERTDVTAILQGCSPRSTH